MTIAPPHFTADLAKLTDALEPWALGDLISPDAPPSLVGPYRTLIEYGYANGWLDNPVTCNRCGDQLAHGQESGELCRNCDFDDYNYARSRRI
jgi:ribosomal protein L37E